MLNITSVGNLLPVSPFTHSMYFKIIFYVGQKCLSIYHCAHFDFIERLVNVKHHIGRNFAPCISVHSFHRSSAQCRRACGFQNLVRTLVYVGQNLPLFGIGLRMLSKLGGDQPPCPHAPACSDDDNESSFLASTV